MTKGLRSKWFCLKSHEVVLIEWLTFPEWQNQHPILFILFLFIFSEAVFCAYCWSSLRHVSESAAMSTLYHANFFAIIPFDHSGLLNLLQSKSVPTFNIPTLIPCFLFVYVPSAVMKSWPAWCLNWQLLITFSRPFPVFWGSVLF